MKKSGKELEHLVSLIEKTIAPGSRVEQNVFLPVLKSKTGARAQCDVVVASGKTPREIVTIIEVQDRKSKTRINDFRGWVQKLEDVGGQRLICVSKHEFSKNIKELASQMGSRVILMTLKSAKPEYIPLDFVDFRFSYVDFNINVTNGIQFRISPEDNDYLDAHGIEYHHEQINTNDRVWSVDRGPLLSIVDLCRTYHVRPKGRTKGVGQIKFPLKGKNQLFKLFGGTLIHIGGTVQFNWTCETTKIPHSVLIYDQDESGAQAWVAEVKHKSLNGGFALRIPVVRTGSGYYLQSMQIKTKKSIGVSIEGVKRMDIE